MNTHQGFDPDSAESTHGADGLETDGTVSSTTNGASAPGQATRWQIAFQVPPQEDRSSDVTVLDRLWQRKICQWMITYLAAAWLVLQLIDVLADMWDWPLQFQQRVSLVLGLGFFPAIVVAWYHGERGRQQVSGLEVTILLAMAVGSALVVWP